VIRKDRENVSVSVRKSIYELEHMLVSPQITESVNESIGE